MGNEDEQDASLVPPAKWFERNRPRLLTESKANEDTLFNTSATFTPNAASPWHAPAYCGLYKGADGAQYFLYNGQLTGFSTVLLPSAGTPQPVTNYLAAHLDCFGFLSLTCNYIGKSSS